jgi:hypothetical protein
MKRILKSLITITVLASVLTGCRNKTESSSVETITAFTNVNLVPMTSETIVENQTVLVEGARIIAIGPADEIKIPGRATIINGTGAYLMPGLADMQTHSQDDWIGSDNWPISPLVLFLANGVTTIRDCGHVGDISLPLQWRDEIEVGNLDGPTIYTTGNVMWGDHRGPVYEGIVQEQLDEGFHFLKLKSLSAEAFYKPMEEANQLGMYTVAHIPYMVGLDGVLSAGLDEIAHIEELYFESLATDPNQYLTEEEWISHIVERSIQLFGTDPSNLSMDDVERIHGETISAVVDKLRSTDVVVGTTLALNKVVMQKVFNAEAFLARPENLYLSRDCQDRVRRGEDRHQLVFRGLEDLIPAKYTMDRLILVKLREAGIPLLLAPDSGGRELCVTPGYSTHDALQILTENGFTPYKAIATSTINASRVIEAMTGEGDFGTIEVGNRADLILVADNPLENVTNIRDPLGVMAAGRWYSRETLQQMIAIEE